MLVILTDKQQLGKENKEKLERLAAMPGLNKQIRVVVKKHYSMSPLPEDLITIAIELAKASGNLSGEPSLKVLRFVSDTSLCIIPVRSSVKMSLSVVRFLQCVVRQQASFPVLKQQSQRLFAIALKLRCYSSQEGSVIQMTFT